MLLFFLLIFFSNFCNALWFYILFFSPVFVLIRCCCCYHFRIWPLIHALIFGIYPSWKKSSVFLLFFLCVCVSEQWRLRRRQYKKKLLYKSINLLFPFFPNLFFWFFFQLTHVFFFGFLSTFFELETTGIKQLSANIFFSDEVTHRLL